MKKIVALILALVMACGLCACGKAAADAPIDESDLGQVLFADFKAALKDNKDISAEDLAAKLCENEKIPFGPASMPVEEGWLNGFREDITGFDEGAMFGPMIGTIPTIGYTFKCASAKDAETLVKTLKDNADLRWNICTEADKTMCENVDNYVFFMMYLKNYEE